MNVRSIPFAAVFAILTAAYSVGCSAEDDLPGAGTPIGSAAYNQTGMCKVDTDCQKGESCSVNNNVGLCVMKRCAGNSFKSTTAPLPANGFLVLDRELMVASNTDVSAFNLSGKSLAPVAAGKMGAGKKIIDVASGNLMGSRPEAVAVITEGSTTITVKQGDTTVPPIEVGFTPIAIAAGMTNQDGHDHIVATKADGNFVICDAKTSQCSKPLSAGVTGVVDVAVGDVDGDGFGEPIFSAADKLVVYNYDGGNAQSGQRTTISSAIGVRLARIAAGDVDGNGTEEVVGVEEAGTRDKIHVLGFSDGGFSDRANFQAAGGVQDVAVGGLGGDNPHVAVVGDGKAEIFEGDGKGGLVSSFTTTAAGNRTTMADIDGDSVPARLKEAPKTVSGTLVPLALLVPPPYSKTYSGDFRGGVKSSVTFNTTASKTDGTSTTKTDSDSITITTGWAVDVGVGPNLGPVGIKVNASFNKSVNDRIGKSVTKSTDFAVTTSIGQSFTFDVRPEIDGYDSGAIVVGCGCYNQYVYDVEDPNHRLGDTADGASVKINIPIGGQTSLWSLRRYNQLAEATKGGLPVITGGPKIGDVDSYPTTLVGIDGKPIPNADLVFGPENTATFPVSDTGTAAFSLDMSKSRTDSTQTAEEKGHGWSYGGSIGLSVNTPIVNVGGNVNYNKAGDVNTSIGNGYSITLANSTNFSGTVPYIKDNPSTPEDEFKAHGYGFTPYVYRAHYETPEKKDAGYFVVTYTVDKN
jgi:hypothetical protein